LFLTNPHWHRYCHGSTGVLRRPDLSPGGIWQIRSRTESLNTECWRQKEKHIVTQIRMLLVWSLLAIGSATLLRIGMP